jgi:carbamoyl-phosphate synthase small subunit
MLGKIMIDKDIDWIDPNKEDLVGQVTIKIKQNYGSGKYKIVLVDSG